jgi:formate dehydrogenase iron-sulfur subunit
MTQAMLIDLTKCIGCRACQTACKQWNDLPAEATFNYGSYENPPRQSANTWTTVSFNEIEDGDQFYWVFAKRQCMHCEHPACASACTVGALQKTADGPVVYDSSKCIGCRYCQYACPFGVPAFEWQKTLGLISKCDMCASRQANGAEPACAKTCPTQAILYGDRDELLHEAKRRLAAHPDRYVDHIYGEHEVGGTAMLYMSAIPFAQLGFPELGAEPIPQQAETIMNQTPTIAIGVLAAATGAYWIMKRRMEKMPVIPVETTPGGPKEVE